MPQVTAKLRHIIASQQQAAAPCLAPPDPQSILESSMSKHRTPGGASSVGLHLTEALLRAGFDVWRIGKRSANTAAALDPGVTGVPAAGADEAVRQQALHQAADILQGASNKPEPGPRRMDAQRSGSVRGQACPSGTQRAMPGPERG